MSIPPITHSPLKSAPHSLVWELWEPSPLLPSFNPTCLNRPSVTLPQSVLEPLLLAPELEMQLVLQLVSQSPSKLPMSMTHPLPILSLIQELKIPISPSFSPAPMLTPILLHSSSILCPLLEPSGNPINQVSRPTRSLPDNFQRAFLPPELKSKLFLSQPPISSE